MSLNYYKIDFKCLECGEEFNAYGDCKQCSNCGKENIIGKKLLELTTIDKS